MKARLAAIFTILLVPFSAHAQCENNFIKWANDLQSKGNVDFASAVCKVWTADPALTIAVLPIAHQENSVDVGQYDLEILVADSDTNFIKAHIFQPSAITYDAVRFTGIAIDTARYQLTPSKRAFGVRISYSGSSTIFPFSTTSLNLFVIDNKDVRPVLKRLIVEDRNGDWDGDCKGTFDTTLRSIGVGSVGTEGYASLIVSEKRTRSINVAVDTNCISKEQQQVHARFVLNYRNGNYLTPKKMMQEF